KLKLIEKPTLYFKFSITSCTSATAFASLNSCAFRNCSLCCNSCNCSKNSRSPTSRSSITSIIVCGTTISSTN
uniref:Secreted protein n=1 Tax=Ascaris lumbricoides TaxID=6252 RepID=A0A0M3HJN4_ASCLU